MYKRKKRVKFKVVFCSLVCLGLVLSSILINRNFNLPNGFIKDGVLFIDSFVTKPFLVPDKYNEKVEENENLKLQLEELQFYKNQVSELESELNKLKDVLEINELLSDYFVVNASVVNRNLDYWYESLIIDKGSNDGITNNMAVVSNGSLVGITNNVSNFSSRVSLFSNKKFPCKVSVKIVFDDNELYGILNDYNNGMYELIGVVENISIPEGSLVVTTGLGNNFPSGLVIGYVSSVIMDNFDLSKIVKVKPSVSFDNINYVSVVGRSD